MFDDVQRAWQAAHLRTGEACDRTDCDLYRRFTARVLAAHRLQTGPSGWSKWCTCGALARSCGVRTAARDLALDDLPDTTPPRR